MVRWWEIIDVNQEKQWTQDRTLWYPCFVVDLAGEKTVHVDLNEPANQKVREPTCHFSGKV